MTRDYNVELAICPNCNATCVVGHDDDNQVLCASCHKTFLAKEIKKVKGSEFEEMVAKAKRKIDSGPWTAIILKD